MSVSNFFRQKQKRVWMIAASAIVVAAVLIVAVTLAIQNHNDRVLNAQIEQSESALRDVGATSAASSSLLQTMRTIGTLTISSPTGSM